MGNISFGSKYFIFSKFSSIPKTGKIEQERAKLEKEFEEFNEFKNSEEFKGFKELEKYIQSPEHKKLLETIRKDKETEKAKIDKYEAGKKSSRFKKHLKFKESQKLKDHLAFKDSGELKSYLELKQEVESDKFKSKLNELEQKSKKEKDGDLKQKFENELAQLKEKLKKFKEKSKSPVIKRFHKFENSTKFKNFLAFEKSKEWLEHLELKKYLNSDEHKSLWAKLVEQEEQETGKIKKVEDFKKSKKFKWYQLLEGSDKFEPLTSWELIFEDDFASGKLDREKWMTRYFWGDKLINDSYALDGDKAFPTDGKNIEISNSVLKIIVRNEKVTGKIWKPPFGFIPQEFDYSTGLISTAKSHRQKYGKIEAKIKVNFAKPVNYNFWMATEKNLPHIDVMKLGGKKAKVDMALHSGDFAKGTESKTADFSGLDVAQDFFIYTLEWTKDKLIWKINGIVVNEQTTNIPDEEMYLVFSAGITQDKNISGLPASMEIDWVRCYKKV